MNNVGNIDFYDIWFSLICGTNCKNATKISELNRTPKEYYLTKDSLDEYKVFTKKQISEAKNIPDEVVDKIRDIHIENDIKSINFTSAQYPTYLKIIPNLPLVLFYKGDISLLQAKYKVSVIGTRAPTRDGTRFCNEICEELVKNNVVIVSGLASGIDSLANKNAIENKGKTIAVLGVSPDRYYPAGNRKLQQTIEKEGLVISEYPAGLETRKSTFVERNRLIAAIGDKLCVVQSPFKSGTHITVDFANEYDRTVYTLPASLTDESMKGNIKLLSLDKAKCCTGASEILLSLGCEAIKETTDDAEDEYNYIAELSELENRILMAMKKDSVTANQLCTRIDIPLPLLNAMLSSLQIEGYIVSPTPGVFYRK